MLIFRIGGLCYKHPWLGNVILTRFQLKTTPQHLTEIYLWDIPLYIITVLVTLIPD